MGQQFDAVYSFGVHIISSAKTKLLQLRVAPPFWLCTETMETKGFSSYTNRKISLMFKVHYILYISQPQHFTLETKPFVSTH